MRITLILILITFLSGFAFPVHAESNPASGPMRYARIKDAPANEDSEHIRLKTIKPDEEENAKPDEQPQTRIWNKYRALAAGKYEDEDKKKEDAAAEKEADEKEALKKAEAEKIEKEEVKPTGIAAIIDEYRRNKAQRSQMHTINVTKPEELAPAAGEDKKEKPKN